MKNLDYPLVEAAIVPEIVNDEELEIIPDDDIIIVEDDDTAYLSVPSAEVFIDLSEEGAQFADEADVVFVAEEAEYFSDEENIRAYNAELCAEEERRQQEFVDDMNTVCLMAAVCLL